MGKKKLSAPFAIPAKARISVRDAPPHALPAFAGMAARQAYLLGQQDRLVSISALRSVQDVPDPACSAMPWSKAVR